MPLATRLRTVVLPAFGGLTVYGNEGIDTLNGGVQADVLVGKKLLETRVGNVLVAAMGLEHSLYYMEDGSLDTGPWITHRAAFGDLMGAIFMVGIMWAIVRRYVQRPYRIRIKSKPEHAWILNLLERFKLQTDLRGELTPQ